MSTPKRIADIIDPAAALAERPDFPAALPCGCRPPFFRCAAADDLFAHEWEAGEIMLRLGQSHDTTPADYDAARARWKDARRAYDQHMRGEEPPIA
jgi:hypothetical protein